MKYYLSLLLYSLHKWSGYRVKSNDSSRQRNILSTHFSVDDFCISEKLEGTDDVTASFIGAYVWYTDRGCYVSCSLSRITISYENMKTSSFIQTCIVNILKRTFLKSKTYFKRYSMLNSVKLDKLDKFHRHKNCA